MNSPQQQVFSHPSSSPPITTLHPSPSQHHLASSFRYPTMFVGTTGKCPALFLSHCPLTTPTGSQQPCGAHVCFPPSFSALTNQSSSITTHDQFAYGPSTPLSPPAPSTCHRTQQTPQSHSWQLQIKLLCKHLIILFYSNLMCCLPIFVAIQAPNL